MKKFDPTKPVQTVHGRPVRILATDFIPEDGPKSIVAAVKWASGYEEIRTYTSEGAYAPGVKSGIDLVNILPAKQLRTRWVVIYPTEQIFMYRTEEEAREASRSDAIAIVPIEISFTEWQGL